MPSTRVRKREGKHLGTVRHVADFGDSNNAAEFDGTVVAKAAVQHILALVESVVGSADKNLLLLLRLPSTSMLSPLKISSTLVAVACLQRTELSSLGMLC